MLRKFASSAVVIGVLLAIAAAPATASAVGPSGFDKDEHNFWMLACADRAVLEITPCTPAMWDEYLDLYDARIKAGKPTNALEPLQQISDSFGESADEQEAFDKMFSDYIDGEYDGVDENGNTYDEARAIEWGKKTAQEQADKKKNAKPSFTPSKSKPRAFMINILGSVLKDATPDKWQREQLANAHQYNHSWEGMKAQFGQDAANPNYVGKPDSYDDYILRKTELQLHGGKNGKPLQVPATKPTYLQKIGPAINGALALTSYPLGSMAGQLGMAFFGVDDVTGTVCANGSNGDEFSDMLVGLVTGNDCQGFRMTQDAIDQANADASAGVIAGKSCSTFQGELHCIQLKAASVVDFGQNLYCFIASGGSDNRVQARIDVRLRDSTDEYVGSEGNFPIGSTGNFNAANDRCVRAFPGESVIGYMTYVPNVPDGTYLHSYRGGGTGPVIIPELGSADPDRTLRCTVLGSDGIEYTAESDPYKESDSEIAAPNCDVPLPDGVRPQNVKVEDTSNPELDPLLDETVTDGYADWFDNYPECRYGACKQDLLIKSSGKSCFDLAESVCADWFSEPNKEDLYQCRYGIHDVALDECYIYAGTFIAGRIEAGAPYADPETGEWSGGQSSPAEGGAAMGTALQNPDTVRECLGTGWGSFNPIEWILKPIKCSFEWAFVPRPTVAVLNGAKLKDAFENRAPGQIAAVVGSWSFSPIMTGCNIETQYSPMPGQPARTVPIVDACSGPMAGLAITSRLITSAAFSVMVFLAVKRSIGGTVDYRG